MRAQPAQPDIHAVNSDKQAARPQIVTWEAIVQPEQNTQTSTLVQQELLLTQLH